MKENAFIGRKGKQFIVLQRVNRLNRVHGFSLADYLPGKKRCSSTPPPYTHILEIGAQRIINYWVGQKVHLGESPFSII